jgi:hypothetical protein
MSVHSVSSVTSIVDESASRSSAINRPRTGCDRSEERDHFGHLDVRLGSLTWIAIRERAAELIVTQPRAVERASDLLTFTRGVE